MYYHKFMITTVSISSRGLIYIPEKVQKKLKIKKPGKLGFEIVDNKIILKPVRDIMEFAGMAKIKAPKDFDFRKYMEENYDGGI